MSRHVASAGSRVINSGALTRAIIQREIKQTAGRSARDGEDTRASARGTSSIPRNIMHRGRWGVAQSLAGTYLYTTSAITVPALKRHVIPSNEILVTPWAPHSLSFVRPLSRSPSFLRSTPSSPPTSGFTPRSCLITLQLLIPPVAVALGRSKASLARSS